MDQMLYLSILVFTPIKEDAQKMVQLQMDQVYKKYVKKL